MRLLLTNDDGYQAHGLCALAEVVSSWAEVVVVAPDRERSGSGRSITLNRPLRLSKVEPAPGPGEWHTVDGTPVDCVNLAVHRVMVGQPPDLVVSGINHGLNLGDDVHYSGTVQAACEASHLDLSAVALSQEPGNRSMAKTAALSSELLERVCDHAIASKRLLLSVNFPAGEVAGLKITRLGHRVYRNPIETKTDPRGREYHWLAGRPHSEELPGTDHAAIKSGCVSISILQQRPVDCDSAELEGVLKGLWEDVLV